MSLPNEIQCTEENPWNKKLPPAGFSINHPDAVEIEEDYGSLISGGSYIRYECPHCLHRFWVQLPD